MGINGGSEQCAGLGGSRTALRRGMAGLGAAGVAIFGRTRRNSRARLPGRADE